MTSILDGKRRHLLPSLVLLLLLAPSLVYILLNLYTEMVVSTGIYTYALVYANQHFATRGYITGFLGRMAIFGLESLASFVAAASSLTLMIKSDKRYNYGSAILTLVTFAVALCPYFAVSAGLPGFVVINDGTNPNTMQSVALLPTQSLSVLGSGSPYNLRFDDMTYATSTSNAITFVAPIGLDLELKDILGLGSLPLIWFAAFKPSEVRRTLQDTISRYPFILARLWTRAMGEL